ncbi:MAG: DUF5693 family protein [Trueperaceae bacterium]|nr:DUF5693 family protein [Trueperaceae bacterium]
MDVKQLRWMLGAVVLLSLLPALWLAGQRIQAEGSSRTVTLLMDEVALAEQADYYGTTSFELAEQYRALGLNGVALYEETLDSLAAEGEIALLQGREMRARAVASGADMPDVSADSLLFIGLGERPVTMITDKYGLEPATLTLNVQTWYGYPGDFGNRPAGPNRADIERWAEAGYDIAYRPRNFPGLQQVGADFPPEANYLIHAGVEVAGHPNRLGETVAASQPYLTGIIEGTPQEGMRDIIGAAPTVRVFGINQDWLNTLDPRELSGKYILAANERAAQLLYVRPYTDETVGDMRVNTELFIEGLRRDLEANGFTVGAIVRPEYDATLWLRALSTVGVIAGLALLATLYPGGWGVVVAAALLALGVLAGGGLNWDALALVAALSFPVIGYGLFPEKRYSILLATLTSLVGAVLLVAVGSDREAMLAAEPFAGVAATLVVPPALFLFQYALRYRRPAAWLVDFWDYRIRLGDVILVMVGVAALGLVLLRRGNFPVIGVSGAELAVRDWLSELFVRPRFKELLGHPLALVALGSPGWQPWIRGVLLTGGVVAQATILNSFSHYHTPLLVSLERTLVALAIGAVIGLLLTPLLHLATGVGKRWLASSGGLQRAG